MFSALRKSKQVTNLALDRVHDYLDLFRVEMKIRGAEMGIRIAGFAVAGLFGLLATVFLGLAIIITFWESDYRALAAWFVVLLYGGIAAAGVIYALKQSEPVSLTDTLRNELRHDIQTIKESL
ncbi:Uncharacterized membrane protein YqjE [Noviherbaspirillum humi]|uniref:Uncharacterized membrane protein YqjE n=2 Tax=Noviherbaspirillum humi TaxID=1688639 RepID=A0A239DSN6_9BURK|nr:Uncharacterized membrane protein YqjE [Noviherbaspirillum humi]